MAIFIPQKPLSFNTSRGEEKIFEELHALPNDYYIFHSFEWINNSKGRTQGEADFVIYNPKRGIIVIEVKSGGIQYKNRQWFQTNMATNKTREIFDPLSQANKSKFKILDLIQNCLSYSELCLVCHAVWFPSVNFKSSHLPAHYSNEIIMDQKSLSKPEEDIKTVFSYWERALNKKTNLSSLASKRIIDVIAPEFMAVPSIKTVIDEREHHFIRLTLEQAHILNYLEEQRTSSIHGNAGTGKTLLAIEKAKKLSLQGEKILFLCYNAHLRNFLKKTYSIPEVEFHNVHSLACDCLGKKASCFKVDMLPGELIKWLNNSDNEHFWNYHHVVIDEGQDMDDELIRNIYKNTEGTFYVFYDRNQLIQKNTLPLWLNDIDCRLVLHKNCRNTAEIFQTSCRVINLQNLSSNDMVRGDKPLLYFCEGKSEILRTIEKIITKHTDNGMNLSDIVILTTETEESSIMSGVSSTGRHLITNEYLSQGILFTTVRKFKGLEAKVIILIDITKSTFTSENKRRIFYVGSSRAKHNLHIIMESKNENDIRAIAHALIGERHIPKDRKGIAKFLNANIF